MGANIEIENSRTVNGEIIADLIVSQSELVGINVPTERVVSMIDEYPILAAVASVAQGETTMRGIGELRVKESDRIAAMARGLIANGVEVEEGNDYLKIVGKGPAGVNGGATIKTFFDHRIAMSFLCLGLSSKRSITIDDSRAIDTSFPNFFELMAMLGAEIN